MYNLFSFQTPNAEFDYLIDPEDVYEANYFGITKDGIVYVRSNLQTADGREQFDFHLLAVDKSWKPKSSRARVLVDVTYTNIIRQLGFSVPERYISIPENFAVASVDNSFYLDVANENSLLRVVCEILFINGRNNANNANPDFGKR